MRDESANLHFDGAHFSHARARARAIAWQRRKKGGEGGKRKGKKERGEKFFNDFHLSRNVVRKRAASTPDVRHLDIVT
jgi:hypothetical protein